jgi:hypothetical protein
MRKYCNMRDMLHWSNISKLLILVVAGARYIRQKQAIDAEFRFAA